MIGLSKLVRDLCPDGVKYRPLEEVFLMRNGYTPSKSNPDFWTNGTIPWFRMEDIRENGGILSDSIQHITPLAVKSEKLFPANSIMLATSATIGEHALLTVDALTNQRFTVFTPKSDLQRALNMKFAFYYFFVIDKWCKENQHISSFPSVDTSKLKKLAFPLPPLAVQEKIVEILDTFTELTAELTDELAAELAARKKQYAYYRDRLLDFGTPERPKDGVEFRPLEEIFVMRNGYTPSKANKDFWTNGTIPWFRMDDIRTNGRILSDSIQHVTPAAVKNGKLFPANSIIMATTATIGEHALIIADSLANQQFTFFTKCKSLDIELDMKFAFYYFFVIDEWCKSNLNVSSFPSVDMAKLKKLAFPIPPLSEQRRIVEILDRFDALCTDLTDGLPAEIAARKKQYEHYRDRLLTFAPLPRG